MPITNWESIRVDYIYGILGETSNQTVIYPTAKDLASKYDVALSSIQRKCWEEKWKIQREKIKDQITNQEGERRISERYTLSARYDAEDIATLEKINKIIKLYLAQYDICLENMEDVDRVINQLEEGDESNLPKIEMKDLNYLIDILQKKHKLIRDKFGEPDKTQASQNNTKEIHESLVKQNDESLNYLDDIVNRKNRKKQLQEKLKEATDQNSNEDSQ